jgi:hypothetical protein
VQTSPEYRALPGYIEVVCKKNNRDEMVPFSAFMDGKKYTDYQKSRVAQYV